MSARLSNFFAKSHRRCITLGRADKSSLNSTRSFSDTSSFGWRKPVVVASESLLSTLQSNRQFINHSVAHRNSGTPEAKAIQWRRNGMRPLSR